MSLSDLSTEKLGPLGASLMGIDPVALAAALTALGYGTNGGPMYYSVFQGGVDMCVHMRVT